MNRQELWNGWNRANGIIKTEKQKKMKSSDSKRDTNLTKTIDAQDLWVKAPIETKIMIESREI
jgi:hypothetical protein